MGILTFKEWLAHFEFVDRPIGDLAKDVKKNDNFPETNDYNELLNYIESSAKHRNVIETFENAWSYYLKDRPD
ncbi:hypothetical protein ABD74_04530 [Brevibacillus laterosporus]|nr:hypothetical protein [Brevibacillus laterosporus]